MSTVENRPRGHAIEAAACSRWPADRVGQAGPDWFDLRLRADVVPALGTVPIATAGTPVEVKSCYPTYGNRKGRWWIRRANHERLCEADGTYVLAVVDRSSPQVRRMCLLDAGTVDALIGGEWWSCGQGGRSAQEYRQLPWTSVFHGLGRDEEGST